MTNKKEQKVRLLEEIEIRELVVKKTLFDLLENVMALGLLKSIAAMDKALYKREVSGDKQVIEIKLSQIKIKIEIEVDE